MKSVQFKSLLAGATFLLFVLSTSQGAYAQGAAIIKGDATEDAKQTIKELNEKMAQAFQSGDMIKVADFYAEDATVIIPGGKKIQGRKAIYDYLASLKNPGDFKTEVSDVNGSGKILYQVGTVTFTADHNGSPENRTTSQVKVWKRDSGWNYKISVDSFN